ncbi:MAG: ABC transporter substrate-binding protein [Solirubrobacteraceae bacterium]
MIPPVRTLTACACASLLALSLSACGAKREAVLAPPPVPFSILLGGAPSAQHAALYLALAHGDLRAAGLDAAIDPLRGGAAPLEALAQRRADVAVASQSELLAARDRGDAVVSIATLSTATHDEPVLAVPATAAEHRGEALRAFLHALAAGAYEAKRNPAQAAGVLLSANPALAGPATSPAPHSSRTQREASSGRHVKASPATRTGGPAALEREIEALTTPAEGKPYGYQSPAQWASLAAELYAARTLHRDPEKLAPPYTDEFLPGEGL